MFVHISLDISITTAVLFPYPFYLIGRSIIVPLACHSALSLLASIFIFPSTISALFTSRLSETISPLLKTLTLHEHLLSIPLSDPAFAESLTTMRKETTKCEANLVLLAAAGRLLGSDLIYSRFAPADFKAFPAICGKLAARADGMAMYFGLIDPNRDRFLGTGPNKSTYGTPIPTVPSTPRRQMSKEASIEPSNADVDRSSLPPSPRHSVESIQISSAPTSPTKRAYLSHPNHPHSLRFSPRDPLFSGSHSHTHPRAHAPEKHHKHHAHSDLLHHSLTKSRSKRREHAVGVFETQKYLNFEFTRFHDPDESAYTGKLKDLLNEWWEVNRVVRNFLNAISSKHLVIAAHGGLSLVSDWLLNVRSGRVAPIRDGAIQSLLGSRFGKGAKNAEDVRKKSHEEQIANIKRVKEDLSTTLQVFRDETRFGWRF